LKALIVGTGVIGAIYGWALSEAGVDVTHFVRKGKQGNFKDGVSPELLDERKGHLKYNATEYALKCVEEISHADQYELIVVSTNVHQVEEALETLVPVSGQAIFLIFTGNWEGTAFIRDDGAYWTNLRSEVHLGEVTGQPTGKLEKVKALFARADMRPDVQESILHWLWLHNASVIGFAAGFAKYRDVAAYLRDKALVRESILSTQELCELCRLRGADLEKYPEMGYLNLPAWLMAPLFRLNLARNESMQRYTAHAASAGSLHETKVYYASMMKTAKELGFEMPHTEALGIYLDNLWELWRHR
jgi:2-dehydropantoate 2-reductase